MKQLKKSPRQQLEKFSTVFMQLGLVLVLFIVFISLEYETEQTAIVIHKPNVNVSNVYTFDEVPVFKKEIIKKVIPKAKQPRVKIIDRVKVVENKEIIDNIIEKPIDKTPVDLENVTEVKIEETIDKKDDPTPKSINFVTKIPVFKGCENLSEKEGRKCFDDKINKLVQRHFNASLANELGLKTGKHRIYTQFVIDKDGKVIDVKINAPHSRLKKETNRVIDKVPDFTPGENNGKKVKVKYTLPISFKVE